MFHSALEISCQQTYNLLESAHSPLLIDCREQHEYDFCRLEGAILVPLSEFRKVDALFSHSQQKAIIYCHHGVRSLYAVQLLHEKGYTNTLSMHGGIDLWSVEIDAQIPSY